MDAPDDGAEFNILRAIDPGRNLLQYGRDQLSLPHHAESPVTTHDGAITDAISKQLLINIISRAHQHLPIHFTGVSNIAATFDFRVNAGAIPALTGEASRARMPIFGSSVAENPTISIAPIEGEKLTKRLLTPFQETKFLLLRQRYDIDLLLRLMAQGSRAGFSRSWQATRPWQTSGRPFSGSPAQRAATNHRRSAQAPWCPRTRGEE